MGSLSTLLKASGFGWKKPRKLCWPFAAGAEAVEAAAIPDFGFFAGTGFEDVEALRFFSGLLVLPFRGMAGSGDCEGCERSSKLFSKLGLLSSIDC